MKKLLLFIIFIIGLAGFASKETLIIFDQSASMYEPFEGQMKFKAAKSAVRKVLANLNDNEYIGLRTIGINPEKMALNPVVTTKTLCTATALLNRISLSNKANIDKSIDYIIPSGMSPIQYTLQTALESDFHVGTDIKRIILVTDGYENCNGDPCSYIRRQMMRRNDLVIDIVAIGVNDRDAKLLQCLTDTTHGTFININTPSDIPVSINSLFNNPKPNIPHPTSYNMQNPVLPEPKKNILYKNYLLEFSE